MSGWHYPPLASDKAKCLAHKNWRKNRFSDATSVGTFREVPVGSFRDIPVTGGIRQEHSYASGTHRHELHKTIYLRGAIDIIRAHGRESVFGIQLQVT